MKIKQKLINYLAKGIVAIINVDDVMYRNDKGFLIIKIPKRDIKNKIIYNVESREYYKLNEDKGFIEIIILKTFNFLQNKELKKRIEKLDEIIEIFIKKLEEIK